MARLQREITGCLQGNQSVLANFNNLTSLWNELDMILPPIRCECEARNALVEREENQKPMQFLNGLNDGYEQARNQVLFLDPLPSVDSAYSMILQVEDQKMTTDFVIDSSGQTAMNVAYSSGDKHGNSYGKQYNFKGKKSKEERMLLHCPHCNRNGHEEKDYFKLHGHPDWYKKLKEGKGKVKANFVEAASYHSEKQNNKTDVSEQNAEIGKMIQSELARCMGQWINQNNGSSSSQKFDANMDSQEEFTGHYAFSILGNAARERWIVD